MSISFESLGLSGELLQSIADMGFEEPSPIQVLAIPPLLAGKDAIGRAQTGTGKTAAFGIPLLEQVEAGGKLPQGLVLCPTRELAIQVAEELVKLAARRRGVFVLPIYGGQSIERQFRALERGAQVVVGTPGRIIDHLQRGTLSLENVRMAVLDEADEMLDMGFREDIEAILEKTRAESQRVLFSATMPPAILDMARRFLREPEMLAVEQKMLTVPAIEQVYYEVRPHQKTEALCRVLDSQGFRKALVFCSTKRAVDEVTTHLQARGYQADALHGDLAQSQRDRVMGRFRGKELDILVATDVAARGIDVDDVDAVVNYDIPHDVESYVHRIGRTGRAGRTGSAFTFVCGRDHYRLRDIIRYTKARIVPRQIPTLRDVTAIRTSRVLDEVRAVMEGGSLDRYINQVEQFLEEDGTSMDMAAALLKLVMERDYGQEQQVDSLEQREASFSRERPWDKDKGEKNAWSGKQERRGPGGKGAAGPMDRLFFNVGSKAQAAPRDFVGAIAGETGMPSRNIGGIEIHDSFSFVEVLAELADDVMNVMNAGVFIRGVKVVVEKAEAKGGKAPYKASRPGAGGRRPSFKKNFKK